MTLTATALCTTDLASEPTVAENGPVVLSPGEYREVPVACPAGPVLAVGWDGGTQTWSRCSVAARRDRHELGAR